jgi:RsiW-degrading membrane proteinase PrsW (M82 family)
MGFLEKPGIALVSAFNAVLLGIPYLAVILWLDRNEKEPVHLLATAFFWGAIMATGASCVVNTLFGSIAQGILGDPMLSGQLTASLSAPFVEEITKGMALWLIWLFFKKDFDNVLDGIIYGAVVGLGFAVFENFIYYVRQPDIASVFQLTWLRGVVAGVGSHACYTALTGAGFGLFRVMRSGCLRWAMPPLGLALAMFVHFSWNTFTRSFIAEGESVAKTLLVSVPTAGLVIHVPFVVLVFGVSAATLWHEQSLIRRYLSTEATPVLHEGEMSRLVPAMRRSLHTTGLLLTMRWGAWSRRRKRNHMLVKLAFEKWHMDKEQESEGHYHATRVLELREKLRALQPEDL